MAIFYLILFLGEMGSMADSKSNIYSPTGKRDPFRVGDQMGFNRSPQSIEPLQKYSVEQFQLKAILKSGNRSQAMFEDPEGKTFILSEGEFIGREKGTISRVLSNEVIVTQRTFNFLGVESLYEKVMSLPQK